MSFGLSRGRDLDPGPVAAPPLPPLPDDVVTNPRAGWMDVRAWFAHPDRPLEIEIGSGKGTFLLQEAEDRPETNFLGIEWAREFYEYAADRIRRRGLANVRMLNTDATEFLRWRVPDACCRVIHLYFSDPWPKSRHHRRRVVQDRFLLDAARVLESRGELRIVTDHEEYWRWMLEHFSRWCVPGARAPDLSGKLGTALGPEMADRPWELLGFAPPASAGEGELVGTNFERKYRLEGRPFHAAVLRKLK